MTSGQRADARRNRERVLAAAEAVFADHGTSASTEEIARAAGVGIGTVFRHFPTKEALLEAVFLNRLRRLAGRAEAMAAAADPGEALFEFLREAVGQAASKHAYLDALAEAGVDLDIAGTPAGQDLYRAIGALLSLAQDAGAVRADIGVPELLAALVGASRAVEFAGRDPDAGDPAARDRVLAIVLDGLRKRPG